MEGVALLSERTSPSRSPTPRPKVPDGGNGEARRTCKAGYRSRGVDPLVETHDSLRVDEQAMKAVMAALQAVLRGTTASPYARAPHRLLGAPAALRTPSAAVGDRQQRPHRFDALRGDSRRRAALPPAAREAPELSAPGRAKANIPDPTRSFSTWFRRQSVALRSLAMKSACSTLSISSARRRCRRKTWRARSGAA